MAVADTVARQVVEPATIAESLSASRGRDPLTEPVRWRSFSLSEGDAGLALMAAHLDRASPAQGWRDVAGEHLEVAARGASRETRLPMGLFGGLCGLAFAASAQRDLDEGRYEPLRSALDATVSAWATDASLLIRSTEAPGGVDRFDVVSGLVGVGLYLLERREHRPLVPVLEALVWLLDQRHGAPRWVTPGRLMADEAAAELYPHGSLNCGLAHGLAGPLALLSLSLSAGVDVPGQAIAIRTAAYWLLRQRLADRWGLAWPAVVAFVPRGASGSVPPAPHDHHRASWCYGNPGIARALWLSGVALDQAELREVAVDAMHAVIRRPVSERRLESPTFCHGLAGLLQIVLRFAHDTGLPTFGEAAAEMASALLAAHDPGRLFGYVSVEPGGEVDRAGLLQGAAGVVLVLLATAGNQEPTWDRVFALS